MPKCTPKDVGPPDDPDDGRRRGVRSGRSTEDARAPAKGLVGQGSIVKIRNGLVSTDGLAQVGADVGPVVEHRGAGVGSPDAKGPGAPCDSVVERERAAR